MKIALFKTGKAWLPEIEAYRCYFSSLGWSVEVVNPGENAKQTPDVEWRFPGWGCKRVTDAPVLVHDYPGSTQGSFPRLKDLLKRHGNAKPDLRIYLDRGVEERLGFNDDVPHLYRPMGVHASFFQAASQREEETEFDLIYVGGFGGRPEAREAIRKLSLSSERWKILVVGADPATEQPLSGVEFIAPVPYEQVPRQMLRARYGLVLMPNRYPYNIQESTKALEYVATGLGIVSLPGVWIEQFFAERGSFGFILKDKLLTRAELEAYQFLPFDVTDREWNFLLKKSGIAEKLTELLQEKRKAK